MTHAKQISDYVNVETHARMHDELVAMTQAMTRGERWAGMYGMARAMIEMDTPTTWAIAELDRYRRELFPEDFERAVHEGIEPIESWGRDE